MDLESITAEIIEATAQYRDVREIRITEDALKGSVVGVPSIDEDGNEISGLRDILVHPDDWSRLVRSSFHGALYADVEEIAGVPVVFGEKSP